MRARFRLALSVLLASTVGLLGSPAAAQDRWPSRPIRLVVPFTPGGVTDTSGRVVAEFLGRRLGQQVIVDNKPGASGNIGMALVKDAPADGYTLALAFDGTMVINPHVFAKLPFDTLKDFSSIGKIGNATLILVANPNAPVKTVADLVRVSKATPGGLSFGTSGTGGTPHIAGELLKIRTGANLTHVPYKGSGPAVTDLIGGQIDVMFSDIPPAIQHVKSGRLRALAVTSAKRQSALPDVPTVAESGAAGTRGFEAVAWQSLVAPDDTPKELVQKYADALNRVIAQPELRAKLEAEGFEPAPAGGSPEKLAAYIRTEADRWGKVVRAAGATLD